MFQTVGFVLGIVVGWTELWRITRVVRYSAFEKAYSTAGTPLEVIRSGGKQ